ncbi:MULTISPECIES: hypothetical protein [unclassified Paenibacillus]|uniref:hypothetical protein n=1 Tax=unclassified Paenibacillus TaxID=185978 RepID=UPI000415F6A4|nr:MULTISPECIES: hypothetical protein [unclassified Paenibacillus]
MLSYWAAFRSSDAVQFVTNSFPVQGEIRLIPAIFIHMPHHRSSLPVIEVH